MAKNKARIVELKKSAPQEIIKKNADLQTQCQDFSNLIEKVHQFDDLHLKMLETNAHAAKTEGWNIVLVK